MERIKQSGKSWFLFCWIFAIAYLGISYFIRIKLAAEPAVYFWENLKHMGMMKSVIACVVSMIGTVSWKILQKSKLKTQK